MIGWANSLPGSDWVLDKVRSCCYQPNTPHPQVCSHSTRSIQAYTWCRCSLLQPSKLLLTFQSYGFAVILGLNRLLCRRSSWISRWSWERLRHPTDSSLKLPPKFYKGKLITWAINSGTDSVCLRVRFREMPCTVVMNCLASSASKRSVTTCVYKAQSTRERETGMLCPALSLRAPSPTGLSSVSPWSTISQR